MDEVSGDVQMEEDIFSSTIEDDLSSVGFPEDSLSDDGEELFSSENSLVAGSKEKNPPPSYSCGQNLSWTLNGAGTLAIGGEGKMYDFDEYYNNHEPAPWYYESYKIKEIIIYYGVTSIGDDAFVWCSDLTNTSIELPSSITSIGTRAFYGCHITSIIIPDSVTSIGDDAFSECSNLTINGTPGSYAETYANENGIPFKSVSEWPGSDINSVDADFKCYPEAGKNDCFDYHHANGVLRIEFSTPIHIDDDVKARLINLKTGELLNIDLFNDSDDISGLTGPYGQYMRSTNDIRIRNINEYLEPNSIYYITLPDKAIQFGEYSEDGFKANSYWKGIQDKETWKFETARIEYLKKQNPDDEIDPLIAAKYYSPLVLEKIGDKNGTGGVCYGMCYLVAAFEKKYQACIDLFDSLKNTSYSSFTKEQLNYLQMAQYYQYIPEKTKEREENQKKYDKIVSAIMNYLNSNGTPVIIGVDNINSYFPNIFKYKKVSHAILPVKIKEENEKELKIYVYDCNQTVGMGNGVTGFINVLTITKYADGDYSGFYYKSGEQEYTYSITYRLADDGFDRLFSNNNCDIPSIQNNYNLVASTNELIDNDLYEIISYSENESMNQSDMNLYWFQHDNISSVISDNGEIISITDGYKEIEYVGMSGDQINLSLNENKPEATIISNEDSSLRTITFIDAQDYENKKSLDLTVSSGSTLYAQNTDQGIILKTDGKVDISSTINVGDQSQTTSVTNVDSDKDEILVVTGDDKITVMERSEGSESFDTVIADSTGEAAITPTPTPIPTQKLNRPSAPKLTNSSSGIKIAWKAVPNAKKYCVYRKAGGETFLIGTTKKLYFIDKEVANGKAYVYYIQAVGYKTADVIYKKSSKSKGTKIVRVVTPSSLKLSSKKKKTVVVSWTRNTKVKGYQVRCSLKKNMAGAKTVTIKKNKTVKKTLTLKSKKVYYFQVRSYKTVGGKKYYSAWSAKKKIKVK
ncbi:MAG: leucine-rich repeat protein [Blautia sp.]|nr:leucine-rich repeat protein [Blautia sp.]